MLLLFLHCKQFRVLFCSLSIQVTDLILHYIYNKFYNSFSLNKFYTETTVFLH